MSEIKELDFTGLQKAVDEACAKMDSLRGENKLLRQVLVDLYDASPASPDSDALCQAQLAAEKVLGL